MAISSSVLSAFGILVSCPRVIAAAQRARWAAQKKQAQPAKPAGAAKPKKRKMSAAGLKAIREATKKRWAAYHKAKKAAA